MEYKRQYAVWGFWATLGWGFTIGVMFVVSRTAVLAAYLDNLYPDASAQEYHSLMVSLQYNGTVVSMCVITSFIVCSIMIVGIVKLREGSNINHYLGLNRACLDSIRFWFVIVFIFCLCSDLLSWSLGKPVVPEFMTGVYSSAQPLWMLWFALVVAAPVFEELFFRGFLLTGLSNSVLKPYGAIVVTSLLWAAIHSQYELYSMIIIFFMGVLLGMVRFQTQSVLLTISLHAFANLIALIETAIKLT